MIIERDGLLVIQGPMTMETAPSLWKQGEQLVSIQDRILDLSSVTAADSSALALILAWRRAAHAAGVKLRITAPPASFVSLAALYGVDEFILDNPISDDAGHSTAAH